MEEVSIDKIVSAYIKIRDAKSELTSEYNKKVEDLDAQMAVLKHKIVDISKQTGVTSFSTPYGVAYRTVKTQYWTNDWDSFYAFMIENKVPQVLKKAIHQSNLQEYLDSNPDVHPPGLNVDSEYEITIRRK